MVLWNNGEGLRGGFKKMRTTEKKVRRSERGRCRRGFKPDAAAGSTRKPERDHIRLRGVGFRQYRKSSGFPQGGVARGYAKPPCQNGFTTTRITIPTIKIVGTSL